MPNFKKNPSKVRKKVVTRDPSSRGSTSTGIPGASAFVFSNSWSGANVMTPPSGVGNEYRFIIQTPDPDINQGAELAIGALWKGMTKKAGILVPTVSGIAAYPSWVHPYDNYWINRVSCYLFPHESTEWPIRLFATYQAPTGEIGGGVYDIPEKEWQTDWEDAEGPQKWQPYVARPIADHVADTYKDPEKIRYGIYVRDHLFVLQVYDQWREHGHLPFLIEMYGHCRRALKYLEKYHDIDHDGLIETTCVLSDLVVAGDQDINSTARAEDQVLLHGALQAFATMARQLGGIDDAAWADAWAARVKEGLNKIFWRPEGRYMFGIDRASRKPRLEYMTTTYANGYAILFGIADGAQTGVILDFMAKQEFVVPGPYHIPPARVEDKPQNPPGVYCNGGCGWGRGIMPSVAQACYEHGRPDQGFDYLKRQAVAARKAGSFHEYWTWEKYAGKTVPGGAAWYGETSAGFLDVLLHGTFGISATAPGFKSIKIAPRFPETWPVARLELHVPNGSRLGLEYCHDGSGIALRVDAGTDIPVEIALSWPSEVKPVVTGSGLVETRAELRGQKWYVIGQMHGRGEMVLRSPNPG